MANGLTQELLKRIVERAAMAVADLPERLQGPALETVLRFLLEAELTPEKTIRSKEAPTTGTEEVAHFGHRNGMLERVLSTRLDLGEYDILLSKGDLLTRCLVVLYVLKRQLGVEDLTPPEMERVLKHLGIPSAYKTNISNTLRNSRRYVTRTKEGKRYKYALTRLAEDFINERLAKVETRKNGTPLPYPDET